MIFENIIGNEKNKKLLEDIITKNKIANAYMFIGQESIGKFLFAKEFAKAILCLNENKPCNKCKSCLELENSNNPDLTIIEPDGNNVKIEQIRELNKKVVEKPIVSTKKVYIINDGQNITKEAQNALLKTLEEPPSYVIFILATTEPHKIPATILSRCQRFDFKRVTVKDISLRMKYICEKEGIDADEKALNLIARNSQGALRDALSILDQCISFEGNKISYNSFKRVTIVIISLPEETIDLLKQQAETIDTNNLIRVLNILSEAQDGMKVSSNPRVLMEVTMMKIAQPMFDESKEALIKRIENLEQKIESGNIKVNHISTNQTVDNFNENNQQNNNTVEKQEDENIEYENLKGDDIKLVEKSWKKILQKMKEDKNQVIRALLQDVDSFNISEDTLYIIFTDNYSFAKSRLDSPATIQYVEKVIREVLNRSFSVKIALKSQLSNLNTQIKKEDKGEQILKNIESEDILEVKDSIEKR